MRWLFDTMASPEFWKAIVGFATAGGIHFAPEQANAVVALGLAGMGAINAFKHITRNR